MKKLYFYTMIVLLICGTFVMPAAGVFSRQLGAMAIPVAALGMLCVVIAYCEISKMENENGNNH